MFLDLQNLNAELRELNPPQLRDRLIFEAVMVKGWGQCEVAAEQGVSQPRVSQIVAEVGAWLDRALPRARQHESAGGEMAVGMYVARAQIDFLLQQTLHDLEESRKDKVTEKAGTRGVVNWTETKTEGRQIAKVGLLNMALRLSQAKAKLAGVDITGKTQREMALAEERQRREARARGQAAGVRGQESGGRSQEAAQVSAKKPLIKKSEKNAVAAKNDSAQVQAGQEDRAELRPLPEVKEVALNRLINLLRTDAACALWTEAHLREYAEVVWKEQYEDGEPGSAEQKQMLIQRILAAEANPVFVGPRPRTLPRGEGDELRRLRIKRRSPQERRREFLAPLAAG